MDLSEEWYVTCEESPAICKQELDFSCGAACVRQLLLDAGVNVPESDIRSLAEFKEKKGTWAISLAIALDHHLSGPRWLGHSVNENSLDGLLCRAPFIAMLVEHWVIVDRERDGVIHLRDPWGAPDAKHGRVCTMKRSVFIDRWIDGSTQVVYPEESAK